MVGNSVGYRASDRWKLLVTWPPWSGATGLVPRQGLELGLSPARREGEAPAEPRARDTSTRSRGSAGASPSRGRRTPKSSLDGPPGGRTTSRHERNRGMLVNTPASRSPDRHHFAPLRLPQSRAVSFCSKSNREVVLDHVLPSSIDRARATQRFMPTASVGRCRG